MKLNALVLALLLGPSLAATNNPERTFMVWMLADADTAPAAWAARVANIKVRCAFFDGNLHSRMPS
jgi:hypothetical protein